MKWKLSQMSKISPIKTQNQLKPFGESIRMYISCPELYLQANWPKGTDTAEKKPSNDLLFAEGLICVCFWKLDTKGQWNIL